MFFDWILLFCRYPSPEYQVRPGQVSPGQFYYFRWYQVQFSHLVPVRHSDSPPYVILRQASGGYIPYLQQSVWKPILYHLTSITCITMAFKYNVTRQNGQGNRYADWLYNEVLTEADGRLCK